MAADNRNSTFTLGRITALAEYGDLKSIRLALAEHYEAVADDLEADMPNWEMTPIYVAENRTKALRLRTLNGE